MSYKAPAHMLISSLISPAPPRGHVLEKAAGLLQPVGEPKSLRLQQAWMTLAARGRHAGRRASFLSFSRPFLNISNPSTPAHASHAPSKADALGCRNRTER